MNLDDVEARLNKTPGHRTRRTIAPGDGDRRHGTTNGYGNLGCRCEACKEANTKNHAEWAHRTNYRPLKPGRGGERSLTKEEWDAVRHHAQHGDEAMYHKGCRCSLCRYASSVARASRGARSVSTEGY